jgi:hypothetical protein
MTSKLRTVGRRSNIQASVYMFHWLETEINALAGQHKGRGKRFVNSFRVGAATEVATRLVHQRSEIFSAARGSTALVKVQADNAEVKKAVQNMFPRAKTYSTGFASDADGYSEGKRAGRSINLSGGKGLGAPSPQLKD